MRKGEIPSYVSQLGLSNGLQERGGATAAHRRSHAGPAWPAATSDTVLAEEEEEDEEDEGEPRSAIHSPKPAMPVHRSLRRHSFWPGHGHWMATAWIDARTGLPTCRRSWSLKIALSPAVHAARTRFAGRRLPSIGPGRTPSLAHRQARPESRRPDAG